MSQATLLPASATLVWLRVRLSIPGDSIVREILNEAVEHDQDTLSAPVSCMTMPGNVHCDGRQQRGILIEKDER